MNQYCKNIIHYASPEDKQSSALMRASRASALLLVKEALLALLKGSCGYPSIATFGPKSERKVALGISIV